MHREPSPFTTAEFRAWAATKPADEEFDYLDNCGCAIAQFIKATGIDDEPLVGDDDWNTGDNEHVYLIPEDLAFVAGRTTTFGELIERLDQY